ncbi:hypothetical protein CRG98_037170 [Punica granatum]|uniref:Integrase catalytic domain-containing protein n=1 Tax=Punica granatum TaxID=22663 RepID=A0A2I0IEK2_PUNGR|nr:hypothetical protein CRG98_037170 [Punica granatum]
MNGAVEAANKNIKKIIEKMTMLPFALLAYRTSIHLSIEATPYSLVYGMEAVLPIEVEIPSIRRMARAFNKRVCPREFSLGDLFLRKVLHIASDYRGKFAYKYDGPFIVKEVFDGGTIIFNDMDGNKNTLPVNADDLKKYYP